MGDIADMHADQFFDGWWEDFDPEDECGGARFCRRCGKQIEFVYTGVRWRVYEVGMTKPHSCTTPIGPDELKAIED